MTKHPHIRNIISVNNVLLARIISLNNINKEYKTQFFSNEEEILQCGVINYDKKLKPKFHQHYKVNRNIYGTSEALYILSGEGTLQVSESKDRPIYSEKITTGDLVNLIEGAHRILPDNSDLLMIEIKNGPYVSQNNDKFYFQR